NFATFSAGFDKGGVEFHLTGKKKRGRKARVFFSDCRINRCLVMNFEVVAVRERRAIDTRAMWPRWRRIRQGNAECGFARISMRFRTNRARPARLPTSILVRHAVTQYLCVANTDVSSLNHHPRGNNEQQCNIQAS
ncbi:MAG: hypothetical protein KDI69_01850, partial [Xanthomonadales bacterium]|nr:hypothetical protein [Xanthomonadales bacterium]